MNTDLHGSKKKLALILETYAVSVCRPQVNRGTEPWGILQVRKGTLSPPQV